jgi:alpha-1,6-mannosyltransferase
MPTSLHLTNAYHSSSGGIRTFYNALLEAANREGRRVAVVVPGSRDEVEDVGEFGRIYHVRGPQAPAFDRRYRLLLPTAYAPFIGSSIAAILERERPDIVEICDKYTLPYLAALLRRRWLPRVPRPLLLGLSCERFDDNMSAYLSRSRMARTFTQWYLRHIYGPPFDAHIAISEYTALELRLALWDRAPGFVQVCPMGVDGERFRPARRSEALRRELLAQAGGSAESALLMYAGRLSPEKNVPLLLDTLRALVEAGDRDYRLVLAGEGPSSAWIREQAAAGPLAGRVLLSGTLDRDRLADACASADVFIHPNPREPFGIGPLEAMACGVPVVLPDRGGVRTYASERNAWLAVPAPASFAAAVRAALRGDSSRLARARDTVRQFAWPQITGRYFALYDSLIRRRPPLTRVEPAVTTS